MKGMLKGVVLAPWFALTWVSTAVAQDEGLPQNDTPGGRFGRNIYELVTGVSVPVFVCLLGLFALGYLSSRDHQGLTKFAGKAALVGIFVAAPLLVLKLLVAAAESLSNGI